MNRIINTIRIKILMNCCPFLMANMLPKYPPKIFANAIGMPMLYKTLSATAKVKNEPMFDARLKTFEMAEAFISSKPKNM